MRSEKSLAIDSRLHNYISGIIEENSILIVSNVMDAKMGSCAQMQNETHLLWVMSWLKSNSHFNKFGVKKKEI